MTETLVVLAVVCALVAFGVLAVLLPFETLLLSGLACIAVGFLLGVPAGAYYHFKLYRILAARGGVPRGFFWSPTRFHAGLPPHEWRSIMPWFTAGAMGFALMMLGCALLMLGVLRA